MGILAFVKMRLMKKERTYKYFLRITSLFLLFLKKTSKPIYLHTDLSKFTSFGEIKLADQKFLKKKLKNQPYLSSKPLKILLLLLLSNSGEIW